MKKVIFTLLCILFAFSNLFSQPDSTNQELTDKEINEIILDIRNRYNEVNNIETLREENELFDIFYHVTKINWADTTEGFPGVGHKHSTFTFHTIKDQTFKLIHSYQIAEYGGIKEYYFDDENGSLIFYFFKKFEGEGEESLNKSCIINFSTMAVSLGLKGESVYLASKAGVEGFSRSFAREAADFNVRVNCISPGPINTDLIKGVPSEKIDRIVSQQVIPKQFAPSDVCDLVELLLDNKSASLSGQVLNVGGA